MQVTALATPLVTPNVQTTATLSKALSTHSEGKSTIKKDVEGTAVAGVDVNIKLIEYVS